jgi:hypothetical protein
MNESLVQSDPMPERRVLVFPAGTEIGLEIHAALRSCRSVKLFAAGENVSNHARLIYPEYHIIPSVHSKQWLKSLVELCERLAIQYIIPAHDDVIVALSTARDRIPATLVTSNHDACITTRSKSTTYHRLAGIVPVPQLYSTASEVTAFPVLVKPDKGQGSSHVSRVGTREQLASALASTPEPIICEYLPGEEYTVDCLSSQSQGLLFAGARRRTRTRNGISVNTVTEDLPEARPWADAIARELNLRGAWFFQVKRNADGALALLEVAPRIAGAMAAHRVCGINFPLLSILDFEGQEICLAMNHAGVELDRALGNRYRSALQFDTLYMDMETLRRGSTLDEGLMRVVCRCLNEGVRLVLFVNERAELGDRILRVTGLFDQTVNVVVGQPRSFYVNGASAVYVDNDAARRLEVARARNIPTFDASMAELLYSLAPELSQEGKLS